MKGFILYHRKLLEVMELKSIKELYRVTPITYTLSNRLSLGETKFITQSNYSFMGSNQAFLLWKIRLRSNPHLGKAMGGFWWTLKAANQWLKARQRPAPVLSLLLAVLLSESCCWGKCSSAGEATVSPKRESMMGHGIFWENRREKARGSHVTVF